MKPLRARVPFPYFGIIGTVGLCIILPLVLLLLSISPHLDYLYKNATEKVLFILFLSALFVGSITLWYFGLLGPAFGILEIDDKEIRWKCILKKTKSFPTEKCKYIGIGYNSDWPNYAKPFVYFSEFPYPPEFKYKIHKIKKEGFIYFLYTDKISDYVAENFPLYIAREMMNYRNNDPWRKMGKVKGFFKHYFRR